MLFDQFNRPIQARDIKSPETREIATAMLRDRWSTYPSKGLTPDRLTSILRAADDGDVQRQAELFEEMEEKDAHLASQFQTRKLAVQGLPWEILPVSEDGRDRQIADFCKQTLEGLADLDDHILDLLDALAKGYSMMEILWDVSSGQASISALNWIHAKKVTFWQSIFPRVLTEEEPVQGVDPPPFKFVYHRYRARSGYDTRAGIMRVCAFMYLLKNYALKDWAAFTEVYGMPLRVGKYEPGASKADREALITAIRSLGSDAAGIISKSTEIEFIEAQKTTSLNIYESLANFCDAQISKAVLGQTLTSEAGGSKGQGSYALGQVHNEVRQDLIEADCKALSKTITMQILRPLVGFNYGWDAPVPRFRFLYEAPEDLQAAAETYKILREIGFDMSQEHVSARFKVPVRTKGETPLSAPQAMPTPNLAKIMAKAVAAAQDPADVIAAQLQDRAMPAMSDMVDQVRKLVDEAGSLEEIRDRLIDMYGDMQPTRLGEIIQQALSLADLSGRFDAISPVHAKRQTQIVSGRNPLAEGHSQSPLPSREGPGEGE